MKRHLRLTDLIVLLAIAPSVWMFLVLKDALGQYSKGFFRRRREISVEPRVIPL